MLAYLQTVWESVRSSLWATPLLAVLLAAGLAILALSVRIEPAGNPVWYLYSGGAKAAPDFLASLVTAMMTLGTLVISITMVVLTLAAQQLGPRVIQNFMSDRLTQASIGLFAGTIVYLLLALRAVHSNLESVPNLAVTIGTGLVLLSVMALILFVHHLARSIISDNVIERVGHALDHAIAILPKDGGEPASGPVPDVSGHGAPVRTTTGGYIQAVDYERLTASAQKLGALVALALRPGKHALNGAVVGWVMPPRQLTPEMERAFADSITYGSERTPVQDLEYSVRQLVDIALRALSPGINDPNTALAVINRLALSLGLFLRRRTPSGVWRDERGAIRVIAPASSLEGLFDAAFHQIRQHGCDYVSVLMRLTEKLGELAALARTDQTSPIAKHLRLVMAAGRRSIKDDYDLKELESRYQEAMARLPQRSVVETLRPA